VLVEKSPQKSHRRKVRSYAPVTLEDVRTLIRELTKIIDEETGEDEPILLPLPEGLPHFLVGEEVRKIVGVITLEPLRPAFNV
jgi:hypothetical protein